MEKKVIRKRLVVLAVVCIAFVIGEYGTLRAESAFLLGTDECDSVYFLSAAKLKYSDGEYEGLSGVVTFQPDSAMDDNIPFLHVRSADIRMDVELNDPEAQLDENDRSSLPFIEIILKSIEGLPEELPVDSPVDCELQADASVHGVLKSIMVPAAVTLVESDDDEDEQVLEVSADFQVILSDYDIPATEVPSLDQLKQLDFHLHFVASSRDLLETH